MTRVGGTKMTEERVRDDRPRAPKGPNLFGALDRTFGLTAAGTSVPTELRAGLATFLTMAYIMFGKPAWTMAPCSSRPASPRL
jgi:hypothetical protein